MLHSHAQINRYIDKHVHASVSYATLIPRVLVCELMQVLSSKACQMRESKSETNLWLVPIVVREAAARVLLPHCWLAPELPAPKPSATKSGATETLVHDLGRADVFETVI